MRLMPSWASAPRNEGQSAYAAAMPMLAAAGIVVTEISRPITAPDLAVEEIGLRDDLRETLRRVAA